MSTSSKKSQTKPIELECADSNESAMCALMSTAKLIQRFVESKLSQHQKFCKLSGPRIGVLFMLKQAGVIRMGDVAARLHVAARTVTDLVDGLERDGFLRRKPDPSDRRASLLELTPETEVDFEQLTTVKKAFIGEIFSPLTETEKNQLVKILNKVKDGPMRDLVAGISLDEKE